MKGGKSVLRGGKKKWGLIFKNDNNNNSIINLEKRNMKDV